MVPWGQQIQHIQLEHSYKNYGLQFQKQPFQHHNAFLRLIKTNAIII